MTEFIAPLALGTWVVNVLSGSTLIFTAIALITIISMAAYFRMSGITLMLMVGIFVLMFFEYVDNSIYFVLISIGGLLIGFWIKSIVQR
jgi:hypothetical protein